MRPFRKLRDNLLSSLVSELEPLPPVLCSFNVYPAASCSSTLIIPQLTPHNRILLPVTPRFNTTTSPSKMYPTPPSSYERESPIDTFMSNFEMDVDEDAPIMDLKSAAPLDGIGYNLIQLPEPAPEPRPQPKALVVGRLGTPPPPEQPPSLASSYDSVSSDGDFEELYCAYLSEVLRLTDGGVVDLTDEELPMYLGYGGGFVNNVEAVTAGLAAMDLATLEAQMEVDAAFNVEYTEIKDYDANAIVQDVWRFTPTDADRALLCAPLLTTVDLPDVDSAASSGYFGFDAY